MMTNSQNTLSLETTLYDPINDISDITMNVWRGESIALLTPVDRLNRYQPEVLGEIVATLDQGWDVYSSITGRQPSLFSNVDGLATFAVVPETCGAGCGYLGFTGIEIIDDPYFDVFLHDEVASTGRYDQIFFYEMGRNFWFYESKIGVLPVTTAFAIVNRFVSMEEIGVEGSPFNGRLDFEEFKISTVDDLSQLYFENSQLNWTNTVLAGSAPSNPSGWGADDFSASLFWRVYEDFGLGIYGNMWQRIGDTPSTSNPAQATQNWIQSASAATGIDYSFLLKDAQWAFSVGDRADNRLQAPQINGNQKAVLHGFGGNDVLFGSNLNDLIFGGSGADKLEGRHGNNTLVGGSGADLLRSGDGDDALFGGNENDKLLPDRGNDYLVGGEGNDTLSGGRGDDTLLGTSRLPIHSTKEVDTLFGRQGKDTFVLGTEQYGGIVYYSQGGFDDRAVIRDFNRTKDTIQLYGMPAHFRITEQSGKKQAQLIYTANGNNDLIAQIQGDFRGLSLNDSYFEYV